MKRLGIDVGSTTLKCVLLDEENNILFSEYRRHFSRIPETVSEILCKISGADTEKIEVSLSGSAGMGLSEKMNIPFVQEVYAEQTAVKKYFPETDVVIELGGEDAKILFLTNGFEMRMNGTCAGGTGAFIDQMASLLNLSSEELNEYSERHDKVYTIASRCGVFAKSDIQPLINQGAKKENIATGIFYAVVNQTIGGLAQGRRIKGNLLYLGGPLTFYSELRKAFDTVLEGKGVCPDNSLYYVAIGTALSNVGKEFTITDLIKEFNKSSEQKTYEKSAPLFNSEREYTDFLERHEKASLGIRELQIPEDRMYLGIDAGSTTIKLLLCDESGNIFRPFYGLNNGNPVKIVREYLQNIYNEFPDMKIISSTVTGYGEEIVKNAFNIDNGIVETIAHYTAAKKFKPEVDFIIDIGGQDIKCFQIRNGAIDNLYLNEACSSGCGSFLQTFASTIGYSTEDFSKLGLFADAPVNLGSRCTVFMNSSVKQAQKDGASIENISAGLSRSVVKNALYKVIRCAKAEDLGKNIVVQGGTFLNDCVLRAFEQEIGHEVIRPKYSALMGAYGCALHSVTHKRGEKSGILSDEELKQFTHTVKNVDCKGCGNHCSLTINTFNNGRRYIAGNRCSKPINNGKSEEESDIYTYKLSLLEKYNDEETDNGKQTIGIPFGLNFYELRPFFYTFFKNLNFNVVFSPVSTRNLYLEGQSTIPSDTICYPAKVIHGHIEYLIKKNPDAIFYPDMSYNIDEKMGINHFNCPVVAYYPQVIKSNVPEIKNIPFICDFLSVSDKKQFVRRMGEILPRYFDTVSIKQIKESTEKAYIEYRKYRDSVCEKARELIEKAKSENKPVIVLCGRPYHVDPEINHGINTLICKLGATVISEDSISNLEKPFEVQVRNQWTYHARMYACAKYVAEAPKDLNINLVQLVSFGCGVDAITTDEIRRIVEQSGKIYTQIKIDEISNMGAITIRLRSLFAIINEDNK